MNPLFSKGKPKPSQSFINAMNLLADSSEESDLFCDSSLSSEKKEEEECHYKPSMKTKKIQKDKETLRKLKKKNSLKRKLAEIKMEESPNKLQRDPFFIRIMKEFLMVHTKLDQIMRNIEEFKKGRFFEKERDISHYLNLD